MRTANTTVPAISAILGASSRSASRCGAESEIGPVDVAPGDLTVHPVDGAAHVVARADGDAFLQSANWSPDGRQIAFVLQSSNPDVKNRLYVVDAAGNETPQMVAEDTWAPSWQPLLHTPQVKPWV